MDNLEKELKRKINIRNMAIKNMGIQEEPEYQLPDIVSENKENEMDKLYLLLNQSIKEANDNSYQNFYWFLSGKKLFVLIKKVLRKLVRILYGWLLFPIMGRQNIFNGKTVNSLATLKDIVIVQNQKLEHLMQLSSNLEQRIQSQDDEKYQRLQNRIEETDQRWQNIIEVTDQRLQNKIEEIDPRWQNKIEEIDQRLQSKINLQNQKLYNQLDEKLQMLQEEISLGLHNQIVEVDKSLGYQIDEMLQSTSNVKNSMNYFQRQIAPGLRIEVQDKQSIIVDGIGDYELKEMLQQIQQASEEKINDKLIDATDYFSRKVQQEIEKQAIVKKKLIVIFCLRFQSEYGMEAIKNEAYDLFQLLLRESIYDVKLVSLEQNAETPIYSNKMIYVDRKTLKECFDELSPALIIYCESTPYNIFDFNGLLIKNRTLIKLSGQNPLQSLSVKVLDELRHCNDYGVHRYLVESKYAYNIMAENGFRSAAISYPIVDTDRVLVSRQDRESHNSFVIGFASLPMEEKQFYDRGMDLLQEVITSMPNVTFKLLWRNEQLMVPKELEYSENCHIVMGKYDMKLFYQEIDCVIIPYMTSNNNHACSLSGIEAMLNNIPVISTNIAGISEIVLKSGMGIVCDTTSKDIIAGINKLSNNYEEYVGQYKVKQIQELIASKHIISIIEDILEDYFPHNFVTLDEWDNYLQKKDKYLVKGHNAIKEYYQNIEVANSYNEVRFLQYPANYFDAFERASIGIIFKNIFNRNDLKILDIASGDGRIVQENIKFGYCTSIDSSRAMLDIVEKRFGALGDLKTEICDYLSDTMEGKYDAITTFRYIRHYDYVQRKLLYQRIFNNLNNGGILIFDAPNIKYAMKNREQGNWDDFNIYDVFWDEKSIVKELEENNFEVKYLIPIGVKLNENDPVSWTVAAVKN